MDMTLESRSNILKYCLIARNVNSSLYPCYLKKVGCIVIICVIFKCANALYCDICPICIFLSSNVY